MLAHSRIASLLFIEKLIVANIEELISNYPNCDFNDFFKLFNKAWDFEIEGCKIIFLFGLFHLWGEQMKVKYKNVTKTPFSAKEMITKVFSKLLEIEVSTDGSDALFPLFMIQYRKFISEFDSCFSE